MPASMRRANAFGRLVGFDRAVCIDGALLFDTVDSFSLGEKVPEGG